MFVLTRTGGQSVRVGDAVVTVLKSRRGGVRLGIDAPDHYHIVRTELEDSGDEPPDDESSGDSLNTVIGKAARSTVSQETADGPVTTVLRLASQVPMPKLAPLMERADTIARRIQSRRRRRGDSGPAGVPAC